MCTIWGSLGFLGSIKKIQLKGAVWLNLFNFM